VEITTDS